MKSVIIGTVATLAVATLCTASVDILGAAAAGGPPVLAKQLAPARGGSRITVTSSAFSGGGTIPDQNTQNGEDMSPALAWTKGPPGTRSYVVLAEDAGVDGKDPIVHRVMYDISLAITRLAPGIAPDAKFEFGSQGKNIAGKTGYIGPKPPAGQTHPYHFEVFALNTKLNLDPANADRDAVVTAMKGKVLASGDLIGDYTGK